MSYKLAFYVPIQSTKGVLENLFKTGAGTIGNYKECCFRTKGIGQFKPTQDANPHIGKSEELEYVEEEKVEIVMKDKDETMKTINELKVCHPYEEVAYEVYKLENF